MGEIIIATVPPVEDNVASDKKCLDENSVPRSGSVGIFTFLIFLDGMPKKKIKG